MQRALAIADGTGGRTELAASVATSAAGVAARTRAPAGLCGHTRRAAGSGGELSLSELAAAVVDSRGAQSAAAAVQLAGGSGVEPARAGPGRDRAVAPAKR